MEIADGGTKLQPGGVLVSRADRTGLLRFYHAVRRSTAQLS